MDRNLIERTLAGIVFLAVMIFGICFNATSSFILFSLIGLLAGYETTKLFEQKFNQGNLVFPVLALQALSLITSFLLWYNHVDMTIVIVTHFIFFFVTVPIVFFTGSTIETKISAIGTYIVTYIYVFSAFQLFNIMIPMNDFNLFNFFVLYFFILVWTNDTMAYCCGRLFGRTKLAETISPKKTVEGFVGGLVFTTLASGLVAYIWKDEVSYPIMFWVCPVVVGVFATIGDLLESAFKRWIGVKDSGNIIPGHGGILDRFDGAMLAVWPYILVLVFLKR